MGKRGRPKGRKPKIELDELKLESEAQINDYNRRRRRVFDDFHSWMGKEQYSPETIDHYMKTLRGPDGWYDFIVIIKRKKFKDATPQDYQDFLYHLLNERKLARGTVKGFCNSVICYYKYRSMKTMRATEINRYQRIKLIGRPKHIHHEGKDALDPAELEKMFNAADRSWSLKGKQSRTLFYILIYTGGRAQFYSLAWSEIDWRHVCIKKKVKGAAGGKPIEIPLHPILAKTLRAWAKDSGQLIDGKLPTEGYIFPDATDPYCDDNTIAMRNRSRNRERANKHLRQIVKGAGLQDRKPRISAHTIRKTTATMANRLGMDVKTAQLILGHTDAKITQQLYQKISAEEVARGEWSGADLKKASHRLASDNGAPQPSQAIPGTPSGNGAPITITLQPGQEFDTPPGFTVKMKSGPNGTLTMTLTPEGK